jgi:organic radical activating enzyme
VVPYQKLYAWKELAVAVRKTWPAESGVQPYVVCTGGEPLLQLDAALIAAFHAEGLLVHVETNGTIACPEGVDWLCVSPKSGSKCIQRHGNELKLVYPQTEQEPEEWTQLPFEYYYLQPMDGPNFAANAIAVAEYCLAHPQWRVSVQQHKQLGIP